MSGDTRGKRRGHDSHEDHEEHVNHEAWVIPYADMLTLLMALFLVLWALGDPNPDKTGIAAESFRRELGGRGGISDFDIGFGTGGGPLANGGVSVLEGAGPAPMAGESDPNSVGSAATGDPTDEIMAGMPPTAVAPDDPRFNPLETSGEPNVLVPASDGSLPPLLDPGDEPVDEPATEIEGGTGDGGGIEDDAPADPLNEIEQAVRDEAIGSGLSTALGFRREERGLVVSIVADSVLFTEGDADVQPGGEIVLGVIADALVDRPNAVVIEGHTDSRPISTSRYPSNWELSTARATSVLRYLTEQLGFDASRVSAAGYADTHPIAEGTDPESLARNRRVEIVVIG